MTKLWNLILFILMISWRIPPALWRDAWYDIEAAHSAETRKMVWELKKQGRIWEDEEGRLWSTKEED